MASGSGAGVEAVAATGTTAKALLRFRGILMNGKEYDVDVAAESTVAELSHRFTDKVDLEPPIFVKLVHGTTILSPRRPLGECFAAGEVHEVTLVVQDGQEAACELLEAAMDDVEEHFLALLEGGAAVTAAMSDEDARGLGHFYGWNGEPLKLGAGGTALHLAAAWGWGDGCRRALRAPGGAAAAALEAEVFDLDNGSVRRCTPCQLWAEAWGERRAAEVFGAI